MRDDLAQVVRLLAQLSLDAPREDVGPPLPASYAVAMHEVLADSRQTLLVAEVDGQVAGSISLVIVPNLSYGGRPYAILENVVVDEAYRSQGIGEALVEHCLALAREAGCYKVSLTSNKQRLDAHRFYTRLGFDASHEGFSLYL